MMEKGTEDMIHEAFKSGGSITQSKGHDQKLIVALMSLKCCLRNVRLFHTYLVVAKTKIKFSKELGTTQSSKRSSMTGMGNLSLMVSLLRERKLGNMRQEPYFLSTMTT